MLEQPLVSYKLGLLSSLEIHRSRVRVRVITTDYGPYVPTYRLRTVPYGTGTSQFSPPWQVIFDSLGSNRERKWTRHAKRRRGGKPQSSSDNFLHACLGRHKLAQQLAA